MPPIVLDHIGVAASPEKVPELRRLFEVLGLRGDSTEDVPSEGVRTHFVPLPAAASYVELLEPLDPAGTVARFLDKRGPGVHHLSFRVGPGELEPLCMRLRTEGYRLVYPEPRAGAHLMRVNFIHPASACGLLVEIMEPAS